MVAAKIKTWFFVSVPLTTATILATPKRTQIFMKLLVVTTEGNLWRNDIMTVGLRICVWDLDWALCTVI